ncbi:hypothetical protein E2C01_035137 [Portunus trituberculatus]|uniref:Uncharacterized protein n=1 Tax=Portunus trituberculatus TaxID=210409 RepID=A0A5B7F8X1_PORTR|nr:hypothetical protein [Portunus trituberculatus]
MTQLPGGLRTAASRVELLHIHRSLSRRLLKYRGPHRLEEEWGVQDGGGARMTGGIKMADVEEGNEWRWN